MNDTPKPVATTLLERLDAEVKSTVDTIGGFGPIEMGAIKVFYPFIIRRIAGDEAGAVAAFKELCKTLGRVGNFALSSLVADADLVTEAQARGLWPAPDEPDAPPAPPAPPAPTYPLDYVVQVGDTMASIALAHRIHLASIEADNPRAGHPAGNFALLWSNDHLRIRAPEF